jgi:hypothetical protein
MRGTSLIDPVRCERGLKCLHNSGLGAYSSSLPLQILSWGIVSVRLR